MWPWSLLVMLHCRASSWPDMLVAYRLRARWIRLHPATTDYSARTRTRKRAASTWTTLETLSKVRGKDFVANGLPGPMYWDMPYALAHPSSQSSFVSFSIFMRACALVSRRAHSLNTPRNAEAYGFGAEKQCDDDGAARTTMSIIGKRWMDLFSLDRFVICVWIEFKNDYNILLSNNVIHFTISRNLYFEIVPVWVSF